MKVLVVGSGGREHALAWKIAQSPRVSEVFCAPGNAGIADVASCVEVASDDLPALAAFAESHGIDFTVVGPEDPLSLGIVDLFQERGLRVCGPSRAAARIEASKVFAKRLLSKYDIPTAKAAVFDDPGPALAYVGSVEAPLVVKADGLAKGKGVIIAQTREEAQAAVRACMVDKAFGAAGARVMVEEFLTGPEVSVQAFCDGETVIAMEPAQDYKRALDNDQGLNTGGMGSYSPVPVFTPEVAREAQEKILAPTVAAMKEEGCPYRGVLYAGLMLTPDGPKVLEFNARFGDPETQVVLPRLETDLLDILEAMVDGTLGQAQIAWSPRPTVCVVMASGGYPGDYRKGEAITGLEDAGAMSDVMVFHAATSRRDGDLVTTSGRVLGVTGRGDTFAEAADRAYAAVDKIHFADRHFRTDIARRVREIGARGTT
jgi:phosphoribosylamine--glycine ligase